MASAAEPMEDVCDELEDMGLGPGPFDMGALEQALPSAHPDFRVTQAVWVGECDGMDWAALGAEKLRRFSGANIKLDAGTLILFHGGRFIVTGARRASVTSDSVCREMEDVVRPKCPEAVFRDAQIINLVGVLSGQLAERVRAMPRGSIRSASGWTKITNLFTDKEFFIAQISPPKRSGLVMMHDQAFIQMVSDIEKGEWERVESYTERIERKKKEREERLAKRAAEKKSKEERRYERHKAKWERQRKGTKEEFEQVWAAHLEKQERFRQRIAGRKAAPVMKGTASAAAAKE